jgi:hypothetical protein
MILPYKTKAWLELAIGHDARFIGGLSSLLEPIRQTWLKARSFQILQLGTEEGFGFVDALVIGVGRNFFQNIIQKKFGLQLAQLLVQFFPEIPLQRGNNIRDFMLF